MRAQFLCELGGPPANTIDIAMGIIFTYQGARPVSLLSTANAIQIFGVPYYTISLSLNVIITLMIVVRLILHSKNIRRAMGTPAGTSGLYKTIVTMLVESSALYAVSYLLFIGPWGAQSSVSNAFFPILATTQVSVCSLAHRKDIAP